LLGVAGFDYTSAEEVRSAVLQGADLASRLSNAPAGAWGGSAPLVSAGIQRIAEVPIHFADALARRAPALQRTHDAAPPAARMPGSLMGRLGLRDGDRVRVAQGRAEALLPVARDDGVPADCVRVATAHPLTAELGDMFGAVELSRVDLPEKAEA
jgi:NADH-quinone oxidoreductase subunit G